MDIPTSRLAIVLARRLSIVAGAILLTGLATIAGMIAGRLTLPTNNGLIAAARSFVPDTGTVVDDGVGYDFVYLPLGDTDSAVAYVDLNGLPDSYPTRVTTMRAAAASAGWEFVEEWPGGRMVFQRGPVYASVTVDEEYRQARVSVGRRGDLVRVRNRVGAVIGAGLMLAVWAFLLWRWLRRKRQMPARA